MLKNETFEIFFDKSAKEKGKGKGVQKIAEKIHYLRQDAFVDDSKEENDFDQDELASWTGNKNTMKMDGLLEIQSVLTKSLPNIWYHLLMFRGLY